MAGLSGYATSEPIESRGAPVNVKLNDGETVSMPSGVAWDVTLLMGNTTTSVCNIEYKQPGGTNFENITSADAGGGYSNGQPTGVFHGGEFQVSSSGAPAHITGWEVSV